MAKNQELQTYKLLKRFENLATGILGHRVIASVTKENTHSAISDNPATKPSYIYINPTQLGNMTDAECRVVIFHEVGHHLFSPILKIDTPLPQIFYEIMEEVRMEYKLYGYIKTKFSERAGRSILEMRAQGFRNFHHNIYKNVCDYKFLEKSDKHGIFLQFILILHLITTDIDYINFADYLDEWRGGDDYTDKDRIDILKALKLWANTLVNVGKPTNEVQSDFKNQQWADYLDTTTLEAMIASTEKIWPKLKKLLNWPENDNKKSAQIPQLQVHNGGGGLGSTKKVIDKYTIDSFDEMTAKTLAQQIKNTLLNRKMTRFAINQKRGKLHTSQAYRITRDNYSVFKKRQEKSKDLNYTIGFALDTSGSMKEGQKFPFAMQGAYLLAEASKQAKIKIYLTSFNSLPTDYEDFNDMNDRAEVGGDNSIREAVENLIKKPTTINSSRIDIIVTDGVDNTVDAQYLKEVEAKHNRRIVGVGLGLQQGAELAYFKRNFPDGILVENPAELPQAFISLVKKLMM